MPSTPTTPTTSRRRKSSTTNHHQKRASNNSNHSIPTTPTASHSRQSSSQHNNSAHSPTFHRRKSSSIHSLQQDSPLDRSLSNSHFLQSGGVGGAGDLGESLANELAEAWDDDEDEEDDVVGDDGDYEGDEGGDGDGADETNMGRDDDISDFHTVNGNDTSPTLQRHRSNSSTTSPTSDRHATRRKGRRRTDSNLNSKSPASFDTPPANTKAKLKPKPTDARLHTRPTRENTKYDGSEYGSLSESEISTDLPPGLKAAIADVEAVTKQAQEQKSQKGDPFDPHQKRQQQQSQPLARVPEQPDQPSPDSDPVTRLLAELRDLGPQATLETHATRLITSHTALAMHITHQTRALQSLSYTLLSPLSPPPDPTHIDALLPLLVASLNSTPQPAVHTLQDLVRLSTAGRDVIGTLGALSDSLHMSREITNTAARRLRSAREVVGELRREWECAEVGKRWIEEGGWEGRLREREGARVCRDVVGGFEEVCEGWRERLVREGAAVREGPEVGAG
ncbi:MAG: hypothetical protein M1831_005035 [Alyxoria varia]|nr:MAG: hypothetical protein M1831_005035 [Alyxoria varia]